MSKEQEAYERGFKDGFDAGKKAAPSPQDLVTTPSVWYPNQCGYCGKQNCGEMHIVCTTSSSIGEKESEDES